MGNEKEEFDSDLKTIAKSSVIVFIGIILSKVFSYFYTVIIARYFGPADYGLFTLASIITTWFVIISTLGLNNGLIRYISIFRAQNKKSKIHLIFRDSIKKVIISSLISFALLLLLSKFISFRFFNEPNLVSYLNFFAVIIPLTVVLEALLTLVLAYEQAGWYTFIHNFLIGALKVFLIGSFIFIGLGAYSIFLSYILSVLVALIFTIFLLKTKFSYVLKRVPKKTSKDKKLLGEIFQYSWPLLFFGVAWQLFHWTDSFVIGYFMSATEVGIYNAAEPLAFLLTATTATFMQLFFPIINKQNSKKNYNVVNELAKQVGKWIFMVNLPISIILIFFPKVFLGIFFGSEYLSAATPLRFLALGSLVFSLFSVSDKLITMKGKSKIILIDIIIVSIFNLVTDVTLVKFYGINGAALATMFSLVLLSVIFAVQSKRELLALPLRKKMVNLFFASIAPTLILYFLINKQLGVLFNLISLVSFFALYFLMVFLLKGFDRNDMLILRSALRKLKLRK
ncbi:flippase [Candidatus Pacearchaeota archaeon]|nr:flippase [Candidatus Pacearchaeota archaeon]